MGLDEHLMIFMCKYGENSTRAEIERNLLSFVYSLRYYCQRWPRAKMFAQMLGFLREEKFNKKKEDTPKSEGGGGFSKKLEARVAQSNIGLPANKEVTDKLRDHLDEIDGELGELDIPLNDIYLQEFFFYAYCVLSKDRKGFFESKEGRSYVKLPYEDRQSAKILDYLYQDGSRDKGRWTQMTRKNTRLIRQNPLDESETEFIEVDVLMAQYMEDYKRLRKDIQIRIKMAFGNTIANHDGALSFDVIARTMNSVLPKKSKSPSVSFGKEVTWIRAYYYALVCGDNDSEISIERLIAGCNRFGLDSPIPTITKRMNMFGNIEELQKDFERLVKKYQEKFADIEVF